MASKKNTAWFWSILLHYAPLYGHVAIASLVVNLLSLTMPLFVMNVYDRIVPNNAFESLWVLAIGVFVASLIDFVLRTLRGYFVDTAGRNADVLMLGRFMDAYTDIRMDTNPSSSVGGLLGKVREFEYTREFFSSTTLVSLLDLPFTIIFLLLIYALGGALVLVPLSAIPLMVFFALIVQFFLEKRTQKQMSDNMKKYALLGEISAGFETVKAARLGEALTKRWDILVEQSATSSTKARFIHLIAAHGNMLLASFLSIALIVFGVYLIEAGSMSMGSLIACSILQGRCIGPVTSFVKILGNLNKTLLGLKSMSELLSLPRENPTFEQEGALPEGAGVEEGLPEMSLPGNFMGEKSLKGKDGSLLDVNGTAFSEMDAEERLLIAEKSRTVRRALPVDMHFEDVSFAYPGQQNIQLSLANITTTIKRGERVAIIGQSGSGKSTLARLMAGLYLPTQGRVLIGTVDTSRLPMQPFRQNLGFLPQQVVLFSGTIRSNICNAWPKDMPFSEEALLEVAEMCGVMRFAGLHPLGLDMPVGEHGTGLSGGQAQAVALARAMVGNPQSLILDEPTSNLDAESEALLCEKLAHFVQGKTLVVLTHRMSLLRLVDRVIVMNQGRIVKDGPLHEVVQQRPA